ncbi:MAG: choice-of-anchor A family protein [Verrucomicrobiota bacterium]
MKKLAALLALSLGIALPARAAVTYASLGAAGNTNAFIFGNVNTNGGHADGSIVVNGNWSGNYYEVRQHNNTPLPTAPFANNTALYIGGSNNVSNYIRTLSGDAYIAGDKNPIQNNGGGHTYTASYDLAPTIANLKKLSTDLSLLSSTQMVINDPNNVKVNTASIAGNLKVYTIDGSLLGGGKTLDFLNSSSSDTIVVNVTGASVNWGWSNNYDASRILWNFVDATSISINDREFRGTILAPKATVNQGNANINGTLIAQNWNNTGSNELHSHTFTGTVPLPSPAPPVIPVAAPEPAGMMTMGGFLALALCSRRRQTVRL